MRRIADPSEFQEYCRRLRCTNAVTALVPTMGWLHEGHLSLMRWARLHSDSVLVSLFVNPRQFAPGEDLDTYPYDPERDAIAAEAAGVDVLFIPSADAMYPAGHSTAVSVSGVSESLCGAGRPHFFGGVATVVNMLFNLAAPHIAVFGEKDRQQLAVIKRMVADLCMPIKIVGRPTVREADGLAMSSRNVNLSKEDRTQAPNIYAALQGIAADLDGGTTDAEALLSSARRRMMETMPSGRIEYVSIVDAETMQPTPNIEKPAVAAAAVHFDRVRLIDNILLRPHAAMVAEES